jgi:hypothetical protein
MLNKIFQDSFVSEYLSDLIPPTVSETSNYYLHNSQQVNRLELLRPYSKIGLINVK